MASEWHELDNGGGYTIAGWQADGSDWHDVEKGETPFESSPYELDDVEILVYHYQDEAGNDAYFTLYGPFSDWETVDDIIADALDNYGIE